MTPPLLPARRLRPPARTRALAALACAILPAGLAAAQPAALSAPATTPPAASAGPAASPAAASPGAVQPTYTVDELVARALSESPLLAVSRSDEVAARAGITTARAYPNPILEYTPGRASARTPDALGGSAATIAIGQPLENPWLRQSRVQAAERRVDVAVAQTSAVRADLVAAVRLRAFEVVRLREELQAYLEDVRLTEQIRERIEVRVRSGEAPRFDLVRAEGENAVARKNADATVLRLRRASFELKQVVSPSLEDDFVVAPSAARARRLEQADYEAFRSALEQSNPGIALARRELEAAERRIEVERNQVLPQVTVIAKQERDPSITLNSFGVGLAVPLIDRRAGPIAEARAGAERARFELDRRRFEIFTGLDAAWNAYRSATAQVEALEGGIIERARTVLEIAEAAYRLGERGILEYLDAQRQFRLVRQELIGARFEQRAARVELERLAGQ